MGRLLVLASLLATACSKPAGDPAPADGKPEIEVVGPWARSTVAGQTGTAAYLTIANFGNGDDRLLSVEARPPMRASLHSSTIEGGIARMRPLEAGLAIPARRPVTLAPGGAHLMITGLPKPLEPGQTVELTLKFEKSGRRAVPFRVLDEGER